MGVSANHSKKSFYLPERAHVVVVFIGTSATLVGNALAGNGGFSHEITCFPDTLTCVPATVVRDL